MRFTWPQQSVNPPKLPFTTDSHTHTRTQTHTHGINSHLCSSHSNSDGPLYPINCLRNWIALGTLWLWLSKITSQIASALPLSSWCFSLPLVVCLWPRANLLCPGQRGVRSLVSGCVKSPGGRVSMTASTWTFVSRLWVLSTTLIMIWIRCLHGYREPWVFMPPCTWSIFWFLICGGTCDVYLQRKQLLNLSKTRPLWLIGGFALLNGNILSLHGTIWQKHDLPTFGCHQAVTATAENKGATSADAQENSRHRGVNDYYSSCSSSYSIYNIV